MISAIRSAAVGARACAAVVMLAACTEGPEIKRSNPFDPNNDQTRGQALQLQLSIDATETTIALTWNDLRETLGAFEGYVLYRALLPEQADATRAAPVAAVGAFAEVARVGSEVRVWLDRDFLPFGARVEYRMTAYHSDPRVGESPLSLSNVVFYDLDHDLDGDGILSGDCAENYGVINPDAPELCDGIDNDCDTMADDFTEPCYSGPAATLGVGQCQAGARRCLAGEFGGCTDEVLPAAEVCGDGVDNNCDGVADDVDADGDGFVSATCGAADCDDTRASVYPGAVEMCDNLDNDCNSVVDDILGIDDGNPCTLDTCDFASGGVRHDPVVAGTSCDDGDVCNGVETCQGTVCTPGTPPVCDDSNACTADSCDAAVGCLYANVLDGTACDDGVGCTLVDQCSAGACGGTPSNAACDNGAYCDGAETCDALLGCQAGAPPAGDAVPCTDDVCDELNDVVVSTPNNTLCDNGLFCDGAETCSATLGCQAGVAPLLDDGVACTVDGCDEAANQVTHVPNDGLCTGNGGCMVGTCDPVLDCQLVPAANGTGCDDGVACTTADVCTGGSCAGTPDDGLCDDAQACTANTCDGVAGCQFPPINDGGGCDDGVACTTGDVCNSGTCAGAPDNGLCDNGLFCDGAESCNATSGCQPGTAPSLNDGVTCTDDSCDETADQVVHTPNNANCDDGLFCNGVESCHALNDCQPGVPPSLNDGVTCTDDSCDETADQVVHTPNNANCGDGESCTIDTCDSALDCQYTPVGDGTGCDDGVACTTGDVCGGGVCGGTPDSGLCDDGEECTSNTCDALLGCQFPATNEGGACDDGVGCTSTDICTSGNCAGTPNNGACDNGLFCDGAETCHPVNDCQPGTPPSLNDGVSCTVDSCDEDNDVVVHAPNNAACDDGFFCNGGETCNPVSNCQAGTPPVTNDGVVCTVDSCDEANDVVVHTPNDGLCDDGDTCSTDACDPVLDCQYTPQPDGSSCDDGVGCTEGDQCTGGACAGSANSALCDDGAVCNGVETCDPALDCQAGSNAAPGTACADADLCNGNEVCNGVGNCLAGTPLVCGDGLVCNGVETCDPGLGCVSPGNAAPGTPCPDTNLCNGDEECDGAGGCAPVVGSEPGDCAPCGGGQVCAAGVCGGAPRNFTEGFEGGSLSGPLAAAWTTSGDEPWSTSTARPYLGMFSAASGTILDAELSTLNVAVSLGAAGSVSFYYWTVSEPSFDFLIFRVDGVERARYSGASSAWTLATFPLSAGAHVLSWTYDKDSSYSYLGDKVWIDEVSVTGNAANTCDDGNTCDLDLDDGAGGCVRCAQAPATPCDDNDECTLSDTCDAGGICQGGAARDCSDGLFCNGAELCNVASGCQPGVPPILADGVACTDDACDEGSDAVVHAPNDALCDDANFCNGTETCDVGLGCVGGAAPGDGASCDAVSEDCVVQTCQGGVCAPVDRPNCADCGAGQGLCADGACILLSFTESFEGGAIPYNMSTSGDGDWFVQGSTTYLGSYAAQSPALAHNEGAALQLTVTLEQPGSVRFVHREDTEVLSPAPEYVVFDDLLNLRHEIEPGIFLEAGWGPGEPATLWSDDGNLMFSCGPCWIGDFANEDDGIWGNGICGYNNGTMRNITVNGDLVCARVVPNGHLYDIAVHTYRSYSGACVEGTPGGCAAVGGRTSLTLTRVPTGDLLTFAVNGTIRAAWGGNTLWSEYSQDLDVGTHTLTWTFQRDGALSQGSNSVWLDGIEITGVRSGACEDGNSCTENLDGPLGCVACNVDDGQACSEGASCLAAGTCAAGVCSDSPLAPGTSCTEDAEECTVGTCDGAGACNELPVADCSPCAGGTALCRGGVCGQKPPIFGVLNPANGYTFDLEPTTQVTLNRTTRGSLAGDLEYDCAPCASATFANAVSTISDWNGSNFCSFGWEIPERLTATQQPFCARSTTTGTLFDVRLLSHRCNWRGCLGACGNSGGYTSFVATPYLQCDDGNPCTQDHDDGIACFACPLADGTACNDGNECTAAAGACAGGACAAAPLADGTPCSGGFCSAGACVDNPNCVPSGPCKTVSWTGPDLGDCIESNVPAGMACDDGLFCNGPDRCDGAGGCAPQGLNLSDFAACTVDTCDEANNVIVHTPNDGLCSDGVFCNGAERCHAALGCLPGFPPAVDDGNPCTADSCDNGSGSVLHTPVADGTPCGPLLFCAAGACISNPNCATNDPCRVVSWTGPSAGDCQYTPTAAGTPCSDANACTTADACDGAGVCAGGGAVACDDGLVCNGAETCNPASGCVPGTPITPASDGIPCTIDACSEPSGTTTHTPNNAACSDGDACDGVETCDPGAGCVPGVAQPDGVACALPRYAIMTTTNQILLEPNVYLRRNLSPRPGRINGINAQFACGTCATANFFGGSVFTHLGRNTVCSLGAATQRDLAQQAADHKICARSTLTGNLFDIDFLSFKSRRSTQPCVDRDGGLSCAAATNRTSMLITPYALQFCDGAVCTDHLECSDNNICTVDTWDGMGTPDGCHHTAAVDGKLCGSDGNVCTRDSCMGGLCQTPVPNGTPCNADGSLCTPNDTCQEGICKADPIAAACDDGDPCTIDSCQPFTGCVNEPIICDDGKTCTADACVDAGGGVAQCQYTPLASGSACESDGNDCTDDVCDGAGFCGHAPVVSSTACDDQDACTSGDACDVSGQCVGAPLVCDDGLFCNGAETCQPYYGCMPGSPPAADDGIACTVDACDEANDLITHVPNDGRCDDGDPCNGVETCSAVFACVPGSVLSNGTSCDADAADCVTQQCLHGRCQATPRSDCSLCGPDGNDVCVSGYCGGLPLPFTEGFESCNPFAPCFDPLLDWQNDPSLPWAFSNARAFDGSYSLYATVPTFGATTRAQVRFETVSAAAPLTFAYDTEILGINSAHFRVYLDGVQILAAPQATFWSVVATVVPEPGHHVLAFELAYDGWEQGAPAVYIDAIALSGAFCGNMECAKAGFSGSQCIYCALPDGTTCGADSDCVTSGTCATGSCDATFVGAGGSCDDEVGECMAGFCDGAGGCDAVAAADGTPCNGASGDTCAGGVCVTPTWRQLSPMTSPGDLDGHRLVYDAARGEVVLFGGWRSGQGEINETWVWDGDAWVQRFPATSPPPREGHAMIYDEVRQRVVVYGGYWNNYMDDTWLWDGSDWSELSSAARPWPRWETQFAFDSSAGVGVLFGGDDDDSQHGDETWLWNGLEWLRVFPATIPTARFGGNMAFDPNLGAVVMHGGDGVFTGRLRDSWVWTGADWLQLPDSPLLYGREQFAMATYGSRAHVVLFGGDVLGTFNDTWEWNGAHWRQMFPSASPGNLGRPWMTYDAGNDVLLLYAGDQTWVYERP